MRLGTLDLKNVIAIHTQVRAHLLEKAQKDREGGVNDTPIADLEAGGADEVLEKARRPSASVEEAATV